MSPFLPLIVQVLQIAEHDSSGTTPGSRDGTALNISFWEQAESPTVVQDTAVKLGQCAVNTSSAPALENYQPAHTSLETPF